jgi:amidase
MSDLHELTGTEQLRALRSREISATELTRHYLDRIERLGPDLGAFVTVTADLALDEAARADAQRAAGEDRPLLGLPLGIKDLHPTAGVRTTMGSAVFADTVPTEDAWTVGLLRQAGAVLVGKTNAPEFGPTCYTHNDVTDRPAVTPYDPTRYASGSSGGAAAAVAAGLIPVGHASDGAGSTRTPASACYLVGVKPSRGLVSLAPASSFFSTGIEGPVTRTVADAALLLDVMAHPAPGDLYGWQPATTFAEAVRRPVDRPLRVALWTDTGLEDGAPHPESVAAVNRTAQLLRDLGHVVEEIPTPASYDDPTRAALVHWFVTAIGTNVPALVPADKHALLRPYTRYLVEQCAGVTAAQAVASQAVLARYASTCLTALDGFDVALTPTTNGPPVPVGHFFADGVEGEAERMLAWSCYTPWVNLTGQPAVSLPSHLDADGLPHGVQLVGRRQHDTALLSLAAQLEAAGLWQPAPPSCWNS